MGECAYRIKAKWPGKIPEETLTLIKNLFEEHTEAYDYWQEHRNQSGEEFWPEFQKKHPITAQYAQAIGKDPNELSGKMDFGIGDLTAEEDEIFYEAQNVWHFSDWSDLAEWLRSLGAKWVVFDSEEDRLESFEYFDHKTIVQDILKKKEILPTLMHINDELNELIAEELKK